MILRALIVGPLETNCYILGDEKSKEAVVIDPGGDFEEIEKQVKELDLKVKYIVLTHGHFDHTGALAQLKKATGAEVLIHAQDVSMLSPVGQAQPFFMESGADLIIFSAISKAAGISCSWGTTLLTRPIL